MLADEITPAIDGIPAEKAAPLPARGRAGGKLAGAPRARADGRVRARGGQGGGVQRGADQETFSAGGREGWCARATRDGGAPLREQDKVLVKVRSRAGLKANTVVGEATNQARASAELQEVRQRKYIQHTSGY
jgi:hypothetical protein